MSTNSNNGNSPKIPTDQTIQDWEHEQANALRDELMELQHLALAAEARREHEEELAWQLKQGEELDEAFADLDRKALDAVKEDGEIDEAIAADEARHKVTRESPEFKKWISEQAARFDEECREGDADLWRNSERYEPTLVPLATSTSKKLLGDPIDVTPSWHKGLPIHFRFTHLPDGRYEVRQTGWDGTIALAVWGEGGPLHESMVGVANNPVVLPTLSGEPTFLELEFIPKQDDSTTSSTP